jgi:hypothetical protein
MIFMTSVQKLANRPLAGLNHALAQSYAQNYPQNLWIPARKPYGLGIWLFFNSISAA